MPRIKNYVAKTIYARVVGYGPNASYGHIMVPSHWQGKDVSVVQYTNGHVKGKARSKKYQDKGNGKVVMNVKDHTKWSCHIPISSVFIGDVFEITLEDHKELIHDMLSEESSISNLRNT